MMNQDEKQEQYSKSVALFLAELLRTRKITLQRAADIASKVVQNLNLLDTEQDFLRLIKEMSGDFEELMYLQELVQIDVRVNERKEMENHVRHFAVKIMVTDIKLASQVLQDATAENIKFEDLRTKYPELDAFVQHHTHE